jgi:hypothetical protein
MTLFAAVMAKLIAMPAPPAEQECLHLFQVLVIKLKVL